MVPVRNLRNTKFEDYKIVSNATLLDKVLIIPDWHQIPKNPNNRWDYIGESLKYFYDIIEIIEKNAITKVIFLGDIFDRGFSDISTEYLTEIESIFMKMNELVDIFTVVGNHEITYARNNPFYRLTELGKRAEELTRSLVKPKLILPLIKAPDNLIIGGCEFIFNHFNKNNEFSCSKNEDTFKVGLFHHDLVSFDSKQELYHHKIGHGLSLNHPKLSEYYHLIYNGHIHTPLNDLIINNKTLFVNSGSIMRRNSKEMHEKVDLPIMFIYKEGIDLLKYEFMLTPIEESFKMEVVEESRETYQMKKFIKEVRNNSHESESIEELLSKITDDNIKFIISSSDNQLNFKLKSEELYEDIYFNNKI